MKISRTSIKFIVLLSVVALLISNFRLVCAFLLLGPDAAAILLLESRMKSPDVYEPVGRELAVLCQSLEVEIRPGKFGTAWLPKSIRDLHPMHASFEPGYALVAMSGGFYHLGYRLKLDTEISDEQDNHYDLTLITEDNEEPLCSIVIPRTEKIYRDELMRKALEGFNEKISEKPSDISPYLFAYRFLVHFQECDRAEQICRQMNAAVPDHWWPHFSLALLNSGRDHADNEVPYFEKWVASHETFENYFLMSHYYRLTGDEAKACDAIAKAVGFPIAGVETNSNNNWAIAYHAAYFLFAQRRYETAADVCDRVLQVEQADNYRYFEFLSIQIANRFVLGDRPAALSLLARAEQETPSKPSHHGLPGDFEVLKNAILSNNIEGVKAWIPPDPGEFEPVNGLSIVETLACWD